MKAKASVAEWVWYAKANAERGRRGWPVSEIARRMEEDGRGPVKSNQLRAWLKGLHNPRHEIVARIGRVFGWPPGYIEDEAMPYPPTTENAYLDLAVRNLDANGRKVLAALSDPAAAEYLAKALEQYAALRERIHAVNRGEKR